MNADIKTYTDQFNKTLEPLKIMLIDKRSMLSQKEWMGFVDRTRSSILRNPDQYLGPELPEQESLNRIVTSIFDDWLKNLN